MALSLSHSLDFSIYFFSLLILLSSKRELIALAVKRAGRLASDWPMLGAGRLEMRCEGGVPIDIREQIAPQQAKNK